MASSLVLLIGACEDECFVATHTRDLMAKGIGKEVTLGVSR